MGSFRLAILTPYGNIFEGLVDKVICSDEIGQFTVLDKHENIVRTIVAGKIIVDDIKSGEFSYYSDGGIMEVNNSIVTICVNYIDCVEKDADS